MSQIAKKIEETLRATLELADPGLVGCRRRNAWTPEEPSWRWVRGNGPLHLIGDRKTTYTPLGPLDSYFWHDRWLLQFRGGQWNTYWVEDFLDLWSLHAAHGDLPDLSTTIMVLHEDHGVLDVKEVVVPDALNPAHRAEKIIAEATSDPPGRIPKSGARAYRICPHCPVKARCDAQDQLRGDTSDWSPTYPTP